MKILFVSDLFPIKDGKEPRLLRAMLWDWLKEGHSVEIIKSNFLVKDFRNHKKMYKEGIYFENGLKIYNVNYFTPFWFNVTNKLPKDFDINNYDLVVSHMPCGGLMALKLLEKAPNIPYISGIHAADIIILTKKLFVSRKYFLWKLKQVFKRADAISSRSVALKKKFLVNLPQYESKTYVGYSGVNPEIIESEEFFENKVNSTSETFTLSVVASAIKRKNVDIVLEGFAKANIENSKLSIIGDSSKLKKLKRLAKELNVENKIVFEGSMPNAQVLEKLKNSDAFAMLSVRETFGISYLEAGAKANIVITTKDDGVDETCVFNGINGFSCEPNADKLASLLQKIHSLPKEEVRKITFNMRKFLTENQRPSRSNLYLKEGLEIISKDSTAHHSQKDCAKI